MDKEIKEIIEGICKSVNRVEVIDENGRSYVNWNDKNHVEIQFQDNDRTLKIFISLKQKKAQVSDTK